MIKTTVIIGIFLCWAKFANADSFVYRGDGYTVNIKFENEDSSLTVRYIILNSSKDFLLFDPKPQVRPYILDRFNTASIQAGALHFSSYIFSGSVLLKAIAPGDSETVYEKIPKGSFNKKIRFEFDCLLLEKLQTDSIKDLLTDGPKKIIKGLQFNIDHARYYGHYTDFFTLECLVPKN